MRRLEEAPHLYIYLNLRLWPYVECAECTRDWRIGMAIAVDTIPHWALSLIAFYLRLCNLSKLAYDARSSRVF